MFLTVKLLLGRRCSLKVTGQESVAALKRLVSKRLQVPEEQQHLLFRGQLLADDKYLSDYSIGPHASINVIVRPLEKPAPLWPCVGSILAQHFEPEDAKNVLQLVRQEHEERLQKISLEALEQLVTYLLAQEESVPAETEPRATTSELPDQEEVEEKEEAKEEEEEEKEVVVVEEEEEVQEEEVVREEEEEDADV